MILKKINNHWKIYQTLLGRNNYNQSLPNYCFIPYKDGKYYSDCSSSVSFSFNEECFYFGNMATVDMFVSKKYASSGGHQLYKIDEVIGDEIVIRATRAQGDEEEDDG